VRIAVVGIHGHGFASHIRNYPSLPNVEVAALCDIDENLFVERLKWFEQNNKPAPKTCVDIRKLLEDKSIDAISVATPNHWHALAGVWACQETGNTDRQHYRNFVDAIRANNPSIVRGNVEEGHYSCSLIHLANASYRLGRSLNFDPVAQRVVNDDDANRMLTREYRKPFVVPQQV